jgi:ABC-type multidrug transport system fused ATPase/permease subunit
VHVAVSSAVSGAGVWAVLLLLAVRVHQGRLDGIWVAAVTLAVLAAFEAVEGLPLAWQAREQTGDAATRVFEVVDATPAVAEPVGPPAPRPSEPRQGVPVRVEGVTLRDGGRAILRDLSIAIEPGEHLAVVGPSGAGKSTLVALLVRLVDPDEGCLEVGGVDVRRLRPADLRGSVAMLPQQVHVFDETLRENVRLARPRATDAEVAAALAAARLEALAAALPHGLDTRLGEAGARLSAGERQRLGLARVFLSDAPLVLLDEPTAHLDVATERYVLSSARAWARGRTAIVVSHRLACVRRLDRLVVLDRGAVAGSGSHERLLERCEVYRALWHAERQALIDTLPEPDGTGL